MSLKAALALMACTLTAHSAVARDTEYKLKFADVQLMNDPNIKTKLDASIKLYFADQATPRIAEQVGEETSNKKTNGFGKDDEFGCKWAAYSALVSLQERARQLGANAVVGIVGNYKKGPFSSQTDYECHPGTFVIGVALKGTFGKLAP